MAVIVEFTVDREEFALGQALRGMDVELEKIVPTSNTVIPFFWASGGDLDALERHVEESTYIENLEPLETVEDRSLYRVSWTGEYEDLVDGIVRNDGTILESHTVDGTWVFRLRFPDHEFLTDFYDFCTDHDIGINIERVYTLTEQTSQKRNFELTPEQREALVLAYEGGYFETPRAASLADLADEIGISAQALSDRIRRGNEKILGEVLFVSGDES
ncbi:helix-turn-helix domain-containing protein [Halorussus halophilus]|uniref:helix-turn-helix domain-containing protein n=1 Tax=Halorussus halophilus TaxID=2650975 RepID=UPI00130179D8|nr:helix-turn-helix domain-containing protein [Halorussus halophilus]